MSGTRGKTKRQKGKERQVAHSDLNIQFLDPLDPRMIPDHKEYRKRIFEQVCEAGRYQITKYAKRAEEDMNAGHHNSWRVETLKRAMDISGAASTCYKNKTPEVEWRRTVEPLALHRLHREVAWCVCLFNIVHIIS